VHEHERRPRAADEIANAADPAFFEIRKIPFGFRHRPGIFFV
jgi:hypothetical protein